MTRLLCSLVVLALLLAEAGCGTNMPATVPVMTAPVGKPASAEKPPPPPPPPR